MELRTELAATFLQEAVCVWVLSLVSAEESKAAVPGETAIASPSATTASSYSPGQGRAGQVGSRDLGFSPS